MLPDPAGAVYRFADFSQEQLEIIFQSFVRNFFAHHQTDYSVSAERIRCKRPVKASVKPPKPMERCA
jgi:hypothetical protein